MTNLGRYHGNWVYLNTKTSQMRITYVSRYIGSLLSLSFFQKERKAMVYVIKQLLSIMISIPTTLSDDREEFKGYKPS